MHAANHAHLVYHPLFERINDPILILDRQGRVTYANRACLRLLSTSQERLLGLPFSENFVLAGERADFDDLLRPVHEFPHSVDFHLGLRRDDLVPLEIAGTMYGEERDDGHIQYVLVIQKQGIIASIETPRNPLEAILDATDVGIAVRNLDGRYILVNRAFAEAFGESDKQQILDRTDFELFSDDIASVLHAHDREVMESKALRQYEEIWPGDEEAKIYLATRFPLFDMNNRPYAICVIARDISDRKLTEMQLALRNQAIEYSPSGISIADATLPDMPLIYINDAFEQNTGYSALEAIGKNCRFLQGDDRDQEGIRIVREALAAEETATVVLRNYRKDGSLFYNELRIAPIHNIDGKLTHYVGISTDVTDRVEAERKIQSQNHELMEANRELAEARHQAEAAAEQIRMQNEALLVANRNLALARKQAEDATRLKTQFLATMSHELRTPLNAIIGYTEIQLAGMTGDLTEEQQDYQRRVLANADHLLDLINDVLDIAKIEAGRMELVNKPFHLRDWVEEVVGQVNGLTKEKAFEFRVVIDERMPEMIVGDPARIRQIAINLLSNAIKFTSEGHVTLRIRKHNRDAWKLIVEDSGIGIPSHLQETIFEEFRQVDSSSQRKVGGTGLGLSIVRKLALMMGGNVRLVSHVGKGSTFTIFLPLIEATDNLTGG